MGTPWLDKKRAAWMKLQALVELLPASWKTSCAEIAA